MHDKNNPTAILRFAWNSVRLDALRNIVQETIGGLRERDPREVLGRELSDTERAAHTDPIREALDTCCDELRDGSGMPDAPGRAARTELVLRQQKSDWADSYAYALDRYRDAAGVALEASLNKRAPATAVSVLRASNKA